MFHLAVSIFSQTKSLENKIDLFHDKLLDVAMVFKKTIRVYLNEKRRIVVSVRILGVHLRPLGKGPLFRAGQVQLLNTV